MTTALKVTAVAPWFGSNRMLAKEVGRELTGCEWVGIPFAGGMSEVAQIKARTINVNDMHGHVVNLARTLAHPTLGPLVYRRLRRMAFHPRELELAQSMCRAVDWHAERGTDQMDAMDTVTWAVAYFVCAWMPRHGSSGTKGEFGVGLSTRWNAGGGDSAAHYQGAVRSVNAWRRILRRCNFTCLDFRAFLAKCKDEPKHGIYCDPPFPGPGDKYAHRFSQQDHVDLRDRLAAYERTRVVVRYYDVPFVRELYADAQWHWRLLEGRKQTNDAAPEVLILNGPSQAP